MLYVYWRNPALCVLEEACVVYVLEEPCAVYVLEEACAELILSEASSHKQVNFRQRKGSFANLTALIQLRPSLVQRWHRW